MLHLTVYLHLFGFNFTNRFPIVLGFDVNTDLRLHIHLLQHIQPLISRVLQYFRNMGKHKKSLIRNSVLIMYYLQISFFLMDSPGEKTYDILTVRMQYLFPILCLVLVCHRIPDMFIPVRIE